MSHFSSDTVTDPNMRFIKWDTTDGPGTIQVYAFEVGSIPNSRDIYPGLNKPIKWTPGGQPQVYGQTLPGKKGNYVRVRYKKNNRPSITACYTIPS